MGLISNPFSIPYRYTMMENKNCNILNLGNTLNERSLLHGVNLFKLTNLGIILDKQHITFLVQASYSIFLLLSRCMQNMLSSPQQMCVIVLWRHACQYVLLHENDSPISLYWHLWAHIWFNSELSSQCINLDEHLYCSLPEPGLQV